MIPNLTITLILSPPVCFVFKGEEYSVKIVCM